MSATSTVSSQITEATPVPSPAGTAAGGPRLDCLHCGLPIPRARKRRGDVFCCGGCERVHALIEEAGLSRYYTLRSGPGAPPAPAGSGDFAWLDGLLALDGPGPDLQRVSLDIQGIHCAGCLWILDALFRRHPGGLDLRINPALGRADLTWDRRRGDLRDWLRQVEAFGYRLGPPRKEAASGASGLLLRLGVTAAAAMNVMVFSLCYYFGLGPEDRPLYAIFGAVSLGLTALAVTVGGWPFFRGAVAGLRRGVAHLDLPIAVGLVLAFTGSTLAYFRHGPDAAYFDTVATFATLMLVGRWLQERILERNRHALLADGGSDHLAARRYRDGELESISLNEIRPGDELWIAPGDVLPVAGTLVAEDARLRLDWITGESDVREVAPGAPLLAGAANAGESVLRAVAVETFADSRLRDLLERPAPTAPQRPRDLWSRFGAFYVGGVFAFAAAAFLVWIPRGLDRAVLVTTAVLVVTCPCALGLALPLAHELAHVALRRRGVFVRRGDFFDRARVIRNIVFDKTGTLTLGALELVPASRDALATLAPGDRQVLWNLVARSNHPVSRALALALEPERLPIAVDVSARELSGRGLEAVRNGTRYRLGSAEFTGCRSGSPESPYPQAMFASGGRTLAVFQFEERVREDAREEAARLRTEGYHVHLLSGDNPLRVQAVAARLDLPTSHAHGGLTPEAKADWLRNEAPALMVGDGLNDGPAFDAALASATPAVDHSALPARADFYFLGEEVSAVRHALDAARRLHRVVRGNLAFAVAYNGIALTLCFLGLVTPVVAAVLMPVSSAAVVSITAARMRRHAWKS